MDAWLPGEGWDEIAHGFLTVAAREVERSPRIPPGLFGGLSGLAFATASLSRGGARYEQLLSNLDEALAPQAAACGERLRAGHGRGRVSEFDVISGASGIGLYLLQRDVHGVLPQVLSGLVSLAEPQAKPPRWMTPPHMLGDESLMRLCPWGSLNCGLAHGIPGPVALLALALRAGLAVPGRTRRCASSLTGSSLIVLTTNGASTGRRSYRSPHRRRRSLIRCSSRAAVHGATAAPVLLARCGSPVMH